MIVGTASGAFLLCDILVYFSVPPVVLQSVGHTVASKGDAVVIPCGIYSDPDPTITWYKGIYNICYKYINTCYPELSKSGFSPANPGVQTYSFMVLFCSK